MRFYEFSILKEAEARIQHAEDIVFWEGSQGAVRAVESLKKLEQGGHKDVTIKWDGSPAIIFGRNADGEFTFTDKSGFVKKGGVERATSGDDLEQFLLNRGGGANRDKPDRIEFAGQMKQAFDLYEKAFPKDHIGFFKGDLLYYTTPPIQDNKFVFTPNIVTYYVDTGSDIGKRISQSQSGVVIHRQIDEQGNESAINIDVNTFFEGNDVLVFPPVTVSKAPRVIDSEVDNLKVLISKHARNLDDLLNKEALVQLKLTAFSDILYKYVNQKVDTGLANLGSDFTSWLATSKVSKPMQERIITYITEHKAGFQALWAVVVGIQKVKNDIINQFDNHDSDIKASIGDTPGGEGYVLAHPQGDIKLVNRSGFTAANRAVQR
tara:strand:- start:2615 stop:3748 length:1134 start_codon:yes stop_codon:yes gene_type:complete